jgi:hypothetical protein
MARSRPLLSFASGGTPRLRISKADWERIEKAYGHQLSGAVRRGIRKATRQFLDWAVLEHAARPNAEAIARVEAIKAAARCFYDVLMHCPKGIGRDADVFARNLIAEHADLPFTKGRSAVHNLALDGRRLSMGCDRALAELRREAASGAGFRKGDMWDRWVRKLTAVLKAKSLPTAVRKDDKSKADAPSAFVAFLRELQACIPESYRRSHTRFADLRANIALSTAIGRARSPVLIAGRKSGRYTSE